VCLAAACTAIWQWHKSREADLRRMIEALTQSTSAINAANEDRAERDALDRENHHATMLAFAKLEILLAKLESLVATVHQDRRR